MDTTPPPDAGQTAAIPPPPPPTADPPYGAPPAAGEQPIGAPPLPRSQPRLRRRRGVAVSGSAVLVVAGVVIRVFLFSSHGSVSPVAQQYRNAVSTFINKEDGLAPALAGSASDLGSVETLKASALRDFDNDVNALQVPDSAKSDRDALIAADHNYEDQMDAVASGGDGGDLAGAQRTHIDAANRLAHDLGIDDVLYLSSSSTGG